MLEEEVVLQLREAIKSRFIELEKAMPGSEEEETLVKEIQSLISALDRLNQTDIDSYDKQIRRDIESEKNKNLNDLERDKMKFDWQRAGFEVIKIVTPGVIGGAFYLMAQKRVLKFEEVGRIVSSAGRDLHLPNNLFKFWK